MNLINKFEKISRLFKETFCRDFILYGSNVLATVSGSVFYVKLNDPEEYDNLSLLYNVDETISEYLIPTWRYAFDSVYKYGDFRFYMASYWDFRCIISAMEAREPKQGFRYPFKYDKLSEYMVFNPKPQRDLYKTCTLLFGDSLGLMNSIRPWVKQMSVLQKEDIIGFLKERWISLCDLSYPVLEELDISLSGIEYTLADMVFIHRDLSVFGDTAVNIKISDIVSLKNRLTAELFDTIDNLSI